MDIKKHAYIDALRGIAVLGVLADHSALAATPHSEALNWLMLCGCRGVELFFIVSAITLCMSWDSRSSCEEFPKLDFYMRRIFRIVPMFYVAIVLYLWLFGFAARYAAPYGVEKWFVLSTAFFLHGWHPETINSIVPGDWTIAAEMMFYAVFPFLVTRFRSRSSLVILLLASLFLVKINQEAARHFFLYPANLQYLVTEFSFMNILGQLPVFLLGMLTYQFISTKQKPDLLLPLGLLLCFIVSRMFMPWFTFWGIGLTLLVFCLSVYPIKALVNPLTVHLGRLSFSMYLLQFAVLYVFSITGLSHFFENSNVGSILHLVLFTVVTALAATVTFELIEKPGIRLGKRMIEKINARFGPSPDALAPLPDSLSP